MAEYKVRALSCHPDKHPENPQAGTCKQMRIILRARFLYGDCDDEPVYRSDVDYVDFKDCYCITCAAHDFQKLQQAKDVLTDETKRRQYDYWLRSSIAVPFSEWRALNDTAQTGSDFFFNRTL